jgi:hypothetical protein
MSNLMERSVAPHRVRSGIGSSPKKTSHCADVAERCAVRKSRCEDTCRPVQRGFAIIVQRVWGSSVVDKGAANFFRLRPMQGSASPIVDRRHVGCASEEFLRSQRSKTAATSITGK